MSPRKGTSVGGPEGKGQQWRPSHGLERPGLGTLSHRAEQDASQGGADQGDGTRRKQSGHEHGDRRAGSRGGYQETQADKRSGDGDDDSADQNEADGHQAKSTERGGVEGREEPRYQEHSTRRAREQRG